jgi:hypothetical protein
MASSASAPMIANFSCIANTVEQGDGRRKYSLHDQRSLKSSATVIGSRAAENLSRVETRFNRRTNANCPSRRVRMRLDPSRRVPGHG